MVNQKFFRPPNRENSVKHIKLVYTYVYACASVVSRGCWYDAARNELRHSVAADVSRTDGRTPCRDRDSFYRGPFYSASVRFVKTATTARRLSTYSPGGEVAWSKRYFSPTIPKFSHVLPIRINAV